ncbi:MAG: electron transfer flavoprotein subunit alpha/FixB family protein [Acidobacteriia bacterium]|nr:electron transfer flavoprotein subunit alpha/FixB family protein [Terriglobia bacterium]
MSNDVWVVAEHARGQLSESTLETVGKGRELAHATGGKLVALLLTDDERNQINSLAAADLILLARRPEFREFTPEAYGGAIEAALKEAPPRLVLMGSTSVGLDLLSVLSARTGFACLDSCTRLDLRASQLLATCQIYGGKLFVEVALSSATTLVAVVPGSFAKPADQPSGRPEVRELTLPADLPVSRITFHRLIEPPSGDVDITKVPILVAVGRGIQNADNLPLAGELAEALGGAVCASRPVIDQGWLPLTRQVGKSGMTVKPKLYLALGISGAPEHLEGMKQSELIVAVNTDPKAPIFGAAHYGAVTDVVELIPMLTEEARKQGLKKAS